MIGRKLLHYEITEKLGEGGMGVVYMARDTHLDRFVAVKVLPPEMVAHSGRKARFVQEAKAASALNHSSIVTVHDIASDAGHDFIVMEYVDGKTLDQMIPRKGMRLNEALKIAVQIADALAAAHAAGIIHRDMKPANVIVTDKGQVKVLDFGLAKLVERESSDDETTATLAVRTETGAVVGTAAYMSPEQAEGRPVDARSDIFSFGAVLYEVLAGRRAFSGIVREEPKPIEDLPPELRKLIARCLRADPARRFQTMADLKVALEDLKEESDSGSPAATVSKPPRAWTRWPLWAACLLLLLGGGLWLLWRNSSRTSGTPHIVAATYFAGQERHPSFSPDGKQLAFTWDGEKGGNDDIYVMVTGTATALRITNDSSPDRVPAWSPDGTQIAFVRLSRGGAAIYLTSPLGGPERKLTDFLPVPQLPARLDPSISWSPDGDWLAVPEADSSGGNGLFLIPAKQGEKRKVISGPLTELRYHYPAFSPDGGSLAYVACAGERSCDVYVQDLDRTYLPRGVPRRLTRQDAFMWGIAWTPDGRSLVYAATPDTSVSVRLWRVPVSGDREPERLMWESEAASFPALSRSGNRLAYSRSRPPEAFIWKFEKGAALTTLFPSGRESDPRFSPDGKRVAFNANRAGKGAELWVANSDGTNQVRLLEGSERMVGAVKWSPDGRWLVYNAQQADGRWDNFRIDATGGQPYNLTSHPADETLPGYSRDGKWIYFASNRSGRFEVWRMPAEGGDPVQVTGNGGFEALESWDGRTLYYTKGWYSPLFGRPVNGGPESLVLESVSLAVLSFEVTRNGIYYVWRPPDKGPAPFEIRFLSFETGKTETLTRFQAGGNQGLTVSPDRKTILFGFWSRRNDDLMLVENFR